MKNLAYSIIHHCNGKTIIIDFDLINLIDRHNKYYKRAKTKLSVNETTIILLKTLDELFHLFKQCNLIFIENQPSFKNPRTKTLSIIIYTYFIQKSMDVKTNYKPDNVKLVSPIKKIPGVYEKLSYSKLKKLSIDIVTNYIKDDVHSLYKISKYKKKDDITDSILYILVHLNIV